MSNGGLLEKISEQQPEILDVEISTESSEGTSNIGSSRVPITVFASSVLFLVYYAMQFGIFLDYDWKISLFLLSLSFAILWFGFDLGIPIGANSENFRKLAASLVIASFLAAAALPVIVVGILGGDLSLDVLEYDEDGEEITLTLRKNGLGTDVFEAQLSIEHQEVVVWEDSTSFEINQNDARGDFAKISISVNDFYSGNSLTGDLQEPVRPYTLSISVEGNSDWTRTLDPSFLTRNVTGSGSYVDGIIKSDSEACQDKGENCLVGVVLTGWAGLSTATTIPSNLQFASYSVNAVLMEGNEVAVSYPAISVENTDATWSSSQGKFGSGSAKFGEENSEIRFEGSETHFGGRTYIPLDHFDSAGDYGCYSFTVEVTPSGSEGIISSTTFYDYSNSNGQDIWKQESSC